MSGLIAWLDAAEGLETARVGGKGASLARLGAAGFPVPDGFVVTAGGYRLFHQSLGLDETLGPLLALSARPTAAAVREACAAIGARLEGAALPAALADAIGEATAELQRRTGPQATFAVRSSGVTEDSAGASFAGLYESYLNLATAAQILESVRRCYLCLWEPRAAHYRAIKGIDHRKEAMATVVMRTVASAVSGVAFTLNPVTGAEDEVLINASWGLGEAIVAGLVTPDSYIALKDGSVARKDVFEKRVRVVCSPSGTVREDVPAGLAAAPALDDGQVSLVARTAAAVEKHYGSPVDVEFAFDEGGRFYLLQARPVTAHHR